MRLGLLGLLLIAGMYVVAPGASLAATSTGPLLAGPPTIGGSPVVGQTLTASATTQPATAGSPAPSATFTWQHCNSAGAACTDIATGPTHTLVSADANQYVAVRVTASDGTPANNSAGQSDPLGPVTTPVPAVPATITSLTINGTLAVGQPLTANAAMAGDPPFNVTYQWSRCPTGPTPCVAIGGPSATATYTVLPADVGFTVNVTATASNGHPPDGTRQAATGVVPPTPPTVSTPVAIDNATPVVGAAVNAVGFSTLGGIPAPTTITYQWHRCGTDCVPIPGQTGAAYTPVVADLGLALVVVATTNNGSPTPATSTSLQTGVVTAAPALTRPTISGAMAVGQTLQAGATLGGFPMPTLTFQWQRCATGGIACQDIAGANGAQYTLTTADLGSTMRVRMTASNGTPPDAIGLSAPTTAVQAAGTAKPAFDTTASGTSNPTGAAPGTTTPGTSGASTSTSKARVLSPFPVIRLRGQLLSSGAFVTLFSVKAPVGARVVINCTGKACPKKRVSFVARKATTKVSAFSGLLRAGLRLSIRVSRPGYVGKITTFVIHANGAPARTDRCLTPTTGKVMTCAA